MKLGSLIGAALGGGAGFLIGGPAGAAVGGSIGAGVGGASDAASAQESAANKAAAAQNTATAEQARQYDIARQINAPYMQAGYQGLGRLTGQNVTYTDPTTGKEVTTQGAGSPFDLMRGVGTQPSYDTEYMQKLGDYTQSAGFQAQNKLAQQALNRQLQARGLSFGGYGATQASNLETQLMAQDYDKYRADLANRYKALQGEWSNRRDVNAQEYNQLLNMTKIGQGAASSTQAAGQSMANQAQNAAGNLGNIYSNQGAAQAQYYSGLGQLPANFLSQAASLGTLKNAGWFGSGSSGASNSSGLQQMYGTSDVPDMGGYT